MAAQIGMGMIAAPMQAGITTEQQQAPKVIAPPVPPNGAGEAPTGDGSTPAGSDYQNQQFDSSNLAM
jgi:hypothetical protein